MPRLPSSRSTTTTSSNQDSSGPQYKYLTLRIIHATAKNKKTIGKTAEALHIDQKTLGRYLGKYHLDFPTLLSLEESYLENKFNHSTVFKNIDTCIRTIQINLSDISLEEMRERILFSTSLNQIATSLGVVPKALMSYLEKIGLNYDTIRQAAPSGIRVDKVIEDVTLRDLHYLIRATNAERKVAIALGVRKCVLRHLLGKLRLTYDSLVQLTDEDIYTQYADVYDTPLRSMHVSLKKTPLRYIHSIILQCDSLNMTANRLGVTHTALRNHLIRLKLNFSWLKDEMKDVEQAAKSIPNYDGPKEANIVEPADETQAPEVEKMQSSPPSSPYASCYANMGLFNTPRCEAYQESECPVHSAQADTIFDDDECITNGKICTCLESTFLEAFQELPDSNQPIFPTPFTRKF